MKLRIEDLRQIVDAARATGGAEAGIAAQVFVDLLISAEFTGAAPSADKFSHLLQSRLERHRALLAPASTAIH
ncbi:MAG: hypothetical protein KIT25_03805 [Enhydrobacter sp.]|nr:MAG: hypothetical protein KIT25_03805 [Enhydrobacter sp.]